MRKEQTEGSETLAHKIQTPRNRPKKDATLFSSFCNKYLLLNLAFRKRISNVFMNLIHILVIIF
jgi:hypothetical protein